MGRYKDTDPLTFPIIRGKSEFIQLMYKLMYISCLLTVISQSITY